MSEKNILEIKNLHVSADDKDILRGVDLTIGKNETHVLMGPNGTGKSTLGYAITGNPHYIVTEGDIIFDGENITEMPVNERAKKGIFLSFQNPLEVPGITLSAFIRSALEQKSGKRIRLWAVRPFKYEKIRLYPPLALSFGCIILKRHDPSLFDRRLYDLDLRGQELFVPGRKIDQDRISCAYQLR